MAKEILIYKVPKKFKVKRVNILPSSVMDHYKFVKHDYSERSKQNLLRIGTSGKELAGSNPFMQVCLQDNGLLPERARLATRDDLEEAILFNKDFLSENYTTFGLALVSIGDSFDNHLLSERLSEQLKERNINPRGKLIPLTALKLREDKNSFYGLVFDLNEQANKETIRDLAEFKWDYTKNQGLTCACLFRGKYWTSDDYKLGDFRSDGRVVVVNESEESFTKKALDSLLIS